jgi:putative endonuclease
VQWFGKHESSGLPRARPRCFTGRVEWRKRLGVEPSPPAERGATGFEDREGHRAPFASTCHSISARHPHLDVDVGVLRVLRVSALNVIGAAERLRGIRLGDVVYSLPPMEPRSPYFVYILSCADGTLYVGSTSDLARRERMHNEGRGAKYTAGRRPVRILYSEAHESRSAAQRREAELKRWPRARKLQLVACRKP